MAAEDNIREASIPAVRMWFGVAASIAAWASLGVIDILITWRACVHQEQFGNGSSHPGARISYIVAAALLFLVVVTSGTTSYRNWRSLSTQRELVDATATDRHEFMALLGVFISFTLGMGVLWLSIPPLFIELCARSR